MWTAQDREICHEVGRRYPSDLSDAEWASTARFFAGYRPLSTSIREIVEACLYLVAEGCRWRAACRASDRPGRHAERALRAERGWDGGERLNGRKRHVLTCSAGFLLATPVTAASVHDEHGVDPLPARSHAAGRHLRGL